MAITFLDDLAEVASDPILIDPSSTGALREARANLWAFSLTGEQARGITTAQVRHFLHAISDARSRDLAARHGDHPMEFYCWCDEQAAQLRFSLVSVQHGRLPFAGAITPVAEPDAIIARFLTLPHHDGIQLDTTIPRDATEGANNTVAPTENPQPPLEVWIRRLPIQPVPASG